MADLALPTGDLVSVLLAEARRRMVMLTTLFAVIALAALLVGVTVPRKYESSTTILVQESNIVTGLMEGRAVATGVADRASIAREVIFSRKVLSGILETGGWAAGNPTPIGAGSHERGNHQAHNDFEPAGQPHPDRICGQRSAARVSCDPAIRRTFHPGKSRRERTREPRSV